MPIRVEVGHISLRATIWVSYPPKLQARPYWWITPLPWLFPYLRGVAQIVSAYPELVPLPCTDLCGRVLLIMLINLRGVKESGATFAVPTYFFIVMMFLTVGTGIVRYFLGSLDGVIDPPHLGDG